MKRFLAVFVGLAAFGLVSLADAETVVVTAVGKVAAVKSAMTAVAKVGAAKSMRYETANAVDPYVVRMPQSPEQPKTPFVEGQYVPETYLGMDKRARVSRGLHFFTPFPREVDAYEDNLEVREHGIAVNHLGQPVYFILLTPKGDEKLPYAEFAAYYCFDYTEQKAGGIQIYLYKMTELWTHNGERRNQMYSAPNECAKPTEEAMFW
jgi:hypothetical protein